MSFTAQDFLALLPLTLSAAAAVAVMLAIAVRRDHALTAVLTLIGLALAAATLPLAAGVVPRAVTPLLVVDRYALFFMGLMLGAGFVVAALSFGYLKGRSRLPEEYYVLLLLAVTGALVLVASGHFASFFLGLELLSVALFALIAYPNTAPQPLEAGIKYLILAGVSSAFLLFGMALVYAELGTMEFARMTAPLAAADPRSPLLMAGVALIITGIGFKLSLVPFHLWTPDVYQGAPAPVAALLAAVSKGAVFALLLRFFVQADLYRYEPLLFALGLIAVASMLAGNLLALLQDNVKRVLAYSSIAHLGYLLVAFLAAGRLGIEAASYYLVAYVVMKLGAFGVVSVLSGAERPVDAERLEDYRGLFWRRPGTAAVFTAMLLSLAGIPLTIGFIGKFYVLAAGVDAALWLLVLTVVVGSAIGLYYYVRIIVLMYLPAGAAAGDAPPRPAEGLVLLALTVLLVWLGVYPAPLIRLIHATVLTLA